MSLPSGWVKNALSDPLQKTVEKIDVSGEKATVQVRIPLLIPGLIDTKKLTATRTAELPS